LEEAAKITNPAEIVCNQIFYHLGERTAENRVIPWCQD